GLFQRLAARVDRVENELLGLVDGSAGGRTLLGRQTAESLQLFGEGALLAEETYTQVFKLLQGIRCCDCCKCFLLQGVELRHKPIRRGKLPPAPQAGRLRRRRNRRLKRRARPWPWRLLLQRRPCHARPGRPTRDGRYQCWPSSDRRSACCS